MLGISICNAQNKHFNVYIFVAEECPISISMTPALNEISSRFIGSVAFNLVFPLEKSTITSAKKFRSTYHLDSFLVKLDKNQELTKKLNAVITPEAIITNDNGEVLYKGRINDSYLAIGKQRHIYSSNDLRDALKLLVSGEVVPKPWKKAVGCFITINE